MLNDDVKQVEKSFKNLINSSEITVNDLIPVITDIFQLLDKITSSTEVRREIRMK